MFILSGELIVEYINKGVFSISPFREYLLNPNFYYFTLGKHINIKDSREQNDTVINLESEREFKIPPHGYIIGESLEIFDLSLTKKVFAFLGMPSSVLENGLAVHYGPSIDPHYFGELRFGIRNLLPEENRVKFDMIVGKALFFDVSDTDFTKVHISQVFRLALERGASPDKKTGE